jgi:hypothetical protein
VVSCRSKRFRCILGTRPFRPPAPPIAIRAEAAYGLARLNIAPRCCRRPGSSDDLPRHPLTPICSAKHIRPDKAHQAGLRNPSLRRSDRPHAPPPSERQRLVELAHAGFKLHASRRREARLLASRLFEVTAELKAHRRKKLVLELGLVARAEALVKGGGQNGRGHGFVYRRLDRPAPLAGV